RCRPRLQAAERGRTRLPHAQGPARAAPDPPSPRAPRPRARLPLHARLLPRLAPPPGLEAAALRRRTAARPTRPGRESTPLGTARAESTQQTHHRPPALPLTPDTARRTRHPHPQHDPPPRRRQLRPTHPTNPDPSPRTRADQRLHPQVVTTSPTVADGKTSQKAEIPLPYQGNFGLTG